MLVEMIRRAAYDWVLYLEDSKPHLRVLAEDANLWLFEERPGHPAWDKRKAAGELGLSFLGICESLGLDPETVREGVRRLTPHRIRTLGRIPTNRSKPGSRASNSFDDNISDMSELPSGLRLITNSDLTVEDNVLGFSENEEDDDLYG